jgi:hypothetical protein
MVEQIHIANSPAFFMALTSDYSVFMLKRSFISKKSGQNGIGSFEVEASSGADFSLKDTLPARFAAVLQSTSNLRKRTTPALRL